MKPLEYPRETVEFQPATVTVDEVEVTTGVKFAIVAEGARPTAWVDPVPVDGRIGVMLTGLTPGLYQVYAQVASTPETPVVLCGSLRIT